MDLKELREQLSPFLDGELTEAERAAVETELAEHPDIAIELEACRRVDALYRQLPVHRAPQGFEEAVQRGIAPSRVRLTFGRRLARRPLWPLAAAAAVFAMIIGGVWLLPFPTKRFQTARAPEAEAVFDIRLKDVSEMPQSVPTALTPDAEQAPSVVSERALLDAVNESAAGKGKEVSIVVNDEKGEARVVSKVSGQMEYDRLANKAESGVYASKAAESRRARKTAYAPGVLESPEALPPASAAPAVAADEATSQEKQASAPSQDAVPAPLSVAQVQPKREVGGPPGVAAPSPPAAQSVERGEGKRDKDSFREERHVVLGAPLHDKADRTTPDLPKEPLIATTFPQAEAVGRTFELRHGVWRQTGYQKELAILLRRGSKEFEDFFKEHADLKPISDLGDRVVFLLGGRWYHIEPAVAE